MKPKFALPALALVLNLNLPSVPNSNPPNSNSNRPGADMQGNIGSTIWDPAYAMNMNAQRNAPELPPGERDLKITSEERMNVNPLHEWRGPGAPNVSVVQNQDRPKSVSEEPKIPLEY